MDDLLKYKFESIYEIGEYEIDNFPLFLNTDGCTLIIKDKVDKSREPNEKEFLMYCRPRTNNTKKSIMSSASISTQNSSGSSDNDGIQIANRKVKASQYKDKGLVITVKKNLDGGNFINQNSIIQEE